MLVDEELIGASFIVRKITNKLNGVIPEAHVSAVFNILIDEITKDLLRGKIVKISNFGNFYIKSIKLAKCMISDNTPSEIRHIRFSFKKSIREVLLKSIDRIRTFSISNEEFDKQFEDL